MHASFDIPLHDDSPAVVYRKLSPKRSRDGSAPLPETLAPWCLLEHRDEEGLPGHSYIALGIASRFSLAGNTICIDGATTPIPSDPKALTATIRDFVERAPEIHPPLEGVPFTGGVIGVTGFDFFHRMEPTLQQPIEDDAAVAPETIHCAPRAMLVIDSTTNTAAVLHSGSETERQTLRQTVIDALQQPTPTQQATQPKFSAPRISFQQDEFCDAVRTCQDYIAAGDAYQIVLSCQFEAELESGTFDPFCSYEVLRELNPSAYMYYLDLDETTIVGSSPEALARSRGKRAWLRPIAGTRPRGKDEARDDAYAEELLADPKEAAEHVMLVDLARNDLGRVAEAGKVWVHPSRIIERYSHVMHIVSGVQGTLLEETDGLDLFAACFPAGTVSGAPKVRAGEIIAELEPVPRGPYAGSVGWFGKNGDMDQAICIRSMFFTGNKVVYQAGAGIVSDSSPEAEWMEVNNKAAAVGAALLAAERNLQ